MSLQIIQLTNMQSEKIPASFSLVYFKLIYFSFVYLLRCYVKVKYLFLFFFEDSRSDDTDYNMRSDMLDEIVLNNECLQPNQK